MSAEILESTGDALDAKAIPACRTCRVLYRASSQKQPRWELQYVGKPCQETHTIICHFKSSLDINRIVQDQH